MQHSFNHWMDLLFVRDIDVISCGWVCRVVAPMEGLCDGGCDTCSSLGKSMEARRKMWVAEGSHWMRA